MANNISFTRGDTKLIAVDVLDERGFPYTPASNDILTMTVRNKLDEIVIEKKSKTADVVDVEGGWKVTIQPSDTTSLPYGQYFYDIQVGLEDGYTQTIIPYSTMNLLQEVTY